MLLYNDSYYCSNNIDRLLIAEPEVQMTEEPEEPAQIAVEAAETTAVAAN